MTTIDAISAASAAQTQPPATPAPKQTLDSEVFLKLLVAQLTNQDPSSPMDTNAMIAQTTQLASMEQLTALTTTAAEGFALSMRQTAAALMGQRAQFVDDEGVTRTGLVSEISFAESVPVLTIDGVQVRLDAVTGLSVAD